MGRGREEQEIPRQRRNSAQVRQEIERGAFASQQRSQRSGNSRDDGTGFERGTIGDLRFPRHCRIEPLEHHVCDWFARQNSRCSRDDMDTTLIVFINERAAGQIARATQIFFQCAVK